MEKGNDNNNHCLDFHIERCENMIGIQWHLKISVIRTKFNKREKVLEVLNIPGGIVVAGGDVKYSG
jgi:hypothetical protein